MDNPFDAIESALRDARSLDLAAQRQSVAIARLMIGRLRSVDSKDTLRALKRELSHYDAVRGKWVR